MRPAKKIMSAATDSIANIDYDMAKQPGVSNLLTILALFTHRPLDAVLQEYKGQNQYGPLKAAVADAVGTFLTDFQSELAMVDEDKTMAKLQDDEYLMNEMANATLTRVQRAVGLRTKKTQKFVRSGDLTKPKAIHFDYFAKIDVRVGTVTEAENVAGSDKLIKLQIDLGNETRQVLTGMQEFYKPEDFVGRQVPVLVNLAPRMMMGFESQGMLLALQGEDGPVFLTPEKPLKNGAPLE